MDSNRKIRICMLGPFPPYRGGISSYNFCLGNELLKAHEMLFINYTRQFPEFLYKKEQKDETFKSNFTSEDAQFHNIIDIVNPLSWKESLNLIVKFNAELVVFPWWVSFFAPLYLYLFKELKKRKIKILINCINVYDHENNYFKKLITKLVLKNGDFFVVHSETTKNQLLEINQNAKVLKQLLPIFNFQKTDLEAPSSHEGLNLLLFGFIRKYKGVEDLVEAFADLKDYNIKLRIAGEWWFSKDKVLEIIKKHNLEEKIEIIDRYISDEEAVKFFTNCDAVVLPYRRAEGSSGVIATAYHHRKPVIATDAEGLPEYIEDGFTGKIAQKNNPKSLSESILWLNENLDIDFKTNIEKFISENMSWNNLVEKIDKEFYST